MDKATRTFLWATLSTLSFSCLAAAATTTIGFDSAAQPLNVLPGLRSGALGTAPPAIGPVRDSAAPQPPLAWFSVDEPSAVALVAHGLVFPPKRMDSLARFLQDNGIAAARLALTGHRGDRENLDTVTHAQWLREMKAGYDAAKQLADSHGVPLYFVGFSLGAALGLELSAGRGVPAFDRMVLFAPPLRADLALPAGIVVPAPTGLVALVTQAGMPLSDAIKTWKFGSAAPLNAYEQLFRAMDAAHGCSDDELAAPTLVIMSSADQLADYDTVRRFVAAHASWSLVTVQSKDPKRHIVVDERSVGADDWARIQDAVADHLGFGSQADRAPQSEPVVER